MEYKFSFQNQSVSNKGVGILTLFDGLENCHNSIKITEEVEEILFITKDKLFCNKKHFKLAFWPMKSDC